jgi:hypothetical protein
MNLPPLVQQPNTLAPHFLHNSAQIASADAHRPIKLWPVTLQDYLGLAALPEYVHVGWAVIVGKHDETKTKSAVQHHHSK